MNDKTLPLTSTNTIFYQQVETPHSMKSKKVWQTYYKSIDSGREMSRPRECIRCYISS